MPTTSFNYLQQNVYYFDSACQSLRPIKVIEGELEYYTKYNTCAGRGNHVFVQHLDEVIAETREKLLQYIGKHSDRYCVVFTPNTTYGINMVLSNLDFSNKKNILTTSKEHNSVFLPCQTQAKKHELPLHILHRAEDGSIPIQEIISSSDGLLMINTTSNIDGQSIANLEQVITLAKKENHLVFLDATQSLAHSNIEFYDLNFDCLFGSAHKMYAPSLGFMILKKELIAGFDQTWVGGGTVQNVTKDGFEFISNPLDIHARLEFGLMDYGAICGLNQALDWLSNFEVSQEWEKMDYSLNPIERLGKTIFGNGPSKESKYYMENLSEFLFEELTKLHKQGLIRLLNRKPSSIISFVPTSQTSYTLTKNLSTYGVLARSGYMCCHYYLKEEQNIPPITRFSLGLNNTPDEIVYLIKTLRSLLNQQF